MDPSESASSVKPSRSGELGFAVCITLLIAVVAGSGVAAHVLWRDEVRWWQIAIVSPSFGAMRDNMRFDGVPSLWYGILWLLSRLTSNPLAMQLAHVGIASATVFLFAWRAPFHRAVRCLFPFGYFTCFEYAVISRNYAIVFFLVLAAVAVIASSRPRPLSLGVILGLLTQTSIWGAGFAGVLLGTALLEWMFLAPRQNRPRRTSCALLMVTVFGGCAVCYFDSLPGPGPSFISKWPDDYSFGVKLTAAVGDVWKAWMPLPQWTRHYWNTNVLDDYNVPRFYLSCGLLFVAVMSLVRRPAGLFLLTATLGGLMTFSLLQFAGATRHHGLMYMALVAACWVAATSTRVAIPWPRPARIADWLESRRTQLLVVLLGIHAVGVVGASIADRILPFSAGRQVADFLRREVPADATLAGFDDYCVSPVSFYLGRPIYSPQMGVAPPFYSQDDRDRRTLTFSSLLRQLRDLQKKTETDIVLILSASRQTEFDKRLPKPGDAPRGQLRFLAEFNDSTVADEGATLYVMPYRRPPSTPTMVQP